MSVEGPRTRGALLVIEETSAVQALPCGPAWAPILPSLCLGGQLHRAWNARYFLAYLLTLNASAAAALPPGGFLCFALYLAVTSQTTNEWYRGTVLGPEIHDCRILASEKLTVQWGDAGAGPICTRCWRRSPHSHALLAPGAATYCLALSAGASDSCRPQSPLRTSPPPPAPEGQLGLELPLSPAASDSPARTHSRSRLLGAISGCEQKLPALIAPEGFFTSPCS
ncbi:hypothetical protein QTO34_012875 [Cnephaeus nilssonii]|uniref:Uncharacterized protein n=1 Tax=Cnephaeus nilssonii TaxID=3371016 RepID=A0AA40LC01_CNENI|nr:hypothetical protein QTO34_012875 [Eptesicus nilssonii]